MKRSIESGIYRIENIITGRLYIGSSFDLMKRIWQHRTDLRRGKHTNKYLQSSWNLHGEAAFVFEIVEYCDEKCRLEREQFWINNSNCMAPIGYNSSPVAGNALGIKRSEETKIKIRLAHKNKTLTVEQRLKLRNFERWPHAWGSRCPCGDCKMVISLEHMFRKRLRREKRKLLKLTQPQAELADA